MAFTYLPSTTNIGRVRLLIPDRIAADAFFDDDEITAMLTLESSDVRCAAAMALETMASSEAYVQKVMRVLDLSTNGAATSAALLARAAKLREQAALASAGAGFDIAEWVVNDFSFRELIDNEGMRDA